MTINKTQMAVHQVLGVIPLVMRTLALELRHTGHLLAPPHFRLLSLLAQRPHNLSELARKQAVSLPSMSHSIATLVGRGWVIRRPDPQDRRMVIIELSSEGYQVLAEIHHTLEEQVAERLSSLSPAECDQLLEGLAVLRTAFACAIEKEQSAGDMLCGPGSPLHDHLSE